MEVEEIQSPKQPASKYYRVDSNGGRIDCSKIGQVGCSGGSGVSGGSLEDKGDIIRQAGSTTTGSTPAAGAMNGGDGDMEPSTRFGRQWQHSSRIIRVSRASGGKDRHSKVWTAKGPRDRRVRLSVTTAIQFYDLQDRLGYDQPSKAVEWLIRNASDAINELPSLNNANFPPETPRQVTDQRRSENVIVDSTTEVEIDGSRNSSFGQDHVQQGGSMSKSGCSSNNSETSKGSGLSLSRTQIRVKARERARERTAKEKERDSTEPVSRVTVAAHHHNNSYQQQNQQNNVSSMEQASSFTQLLTAGINTNLNQSRAPNSTPSLHHGGSGIRGRNDAGGTRNLQWLSSSCTATTTPMADYFGNGLMGLSASRPTNSIQLLGNTPLPHVMSLLPFSGTHEIQHQHNHSHNNQQHFPFLSDQHQHHHHHHHLVPVPNTSTTTTGAGATAFGGNDYNLNFSISASSTTSGVAVGFNRGTLQSNSSSPSMLSYLQRFSATDGSSVPFFLGGAPISPVVDNQHHQQYDPAGLQLSYGDRSRRSDQKGKGKN